MSEAALVDAIGRTLTKRGAWWFKTHGAGSARNGIPDIIGAYRGHALALEIKQPGGRATRLQAHELERARRAGALARVVTSPHDVREELDAIDQLLEQERAA